MLAAIAFLALVTRPVVCDRDFLYEAQADAALYRVRPTVKRAGMREGSRDCTDRGRCKQIGYLLGGDPVVVAYRRGGYACAWYRPAKARSLGTYGWVRLDELEPTPATPRWSGQWLGVADDEIRIRPSALPGRIRVDGSTTWSASPEAAAMGGVNIGQVNADVYVSGDRAEVYADGAAPGEPLNGRWDEVPGVCAVRMRQLGPYLLVQDNYSCGGHNVTFSGLYRRQN